MNKRIVFILSTIVLLLMFAACTPLPDLDALTADVGIRDNPADPDGTAYTPVEKSWKVVGTAAIGSGTASYITLSIDAGIPYVGFTGDTGPFAYKFASSAWSVVGNSITTTALTNFSFTVCSGTPYMIWSDTAGEHSRMLSGSSWSDINNFTPDIPMMTVNFAKLVSDGATPYVVYATNAEGYVSRYFSSSWSRSTTSFTFTTGPTVLSLAVSSGVPYVFYSNNAVTNRGSVSTSSTGVWPVPTWSYLQDGGNDYISSTTVNSTSIAIVGTKPHVAYEMATSITVKKYNAGVWGTVGAADFAAGRYVKLASDSAGTLYVAYKDTANGNKITVRKYDGTAWVTVGVAGFSGAVGSYLDFAISQTDGVLYIAYDNADNTSQAQVMKFD